MIDGGKDSVPDNQKISAKSKQNSGGGRDEFGRAIARIAITQICDSTGFHSSCKSAIDSLADVAIRYIVDLGKAAVFNANLSGRTASNVLDVIQGLEELSSSQGFSGASNVNRCLVSSGVLKEISQFVNIEEEVPFARSIPSFPVVRNEKFTSSSAQKGEEPKGKHIPDWLPVFPDPCTYVYTPVWDEKETDLCAEKIEQARQRRKQDRSLLNLQQMLATCNSRASPARKIDDDGVVKGKQIVGRNNPFLAPPLPAGEKEVSEVVPSEERSHDKRISVLEAFAGTSNNGSLEPEEDKLLPGKRPIVNFNLRIQKKSVRTPLLVPLSDLHYKADLWSPRDEGNDDKKRRAEIILKEAMENPQELTQL